MNAFFKSQFSYHPLLWMYLSLANIKINRLHESCLHVIHSDKTLSFEALLEKNSSVSIHDRNLQFFDSEMRKTSEGRSSPIITKLSQQKNEHHNLRHNSEFTIPACQFGPNYGTERISFLGSKIWKNLALKVERLKNVGVDFAGDIFTMFA